VSRVAGDVYFSVGRTLDVAEGYANAASNAR
jgi:hypothetical protein